MDFRPEEPLIPQQLVGQHDGLIDVVADFLFADDGADQDAVGVGRQHRPFHHPFVAGVGNIARLMRHHLPPALRRHPLLQLLRRLPELVERRVDRRRIQQRYRPADEHLAQRQRAGHAGMLRVGGAIDQRRQLPPVIAVNLRNLQPGQRLPLVGEQQRIPGGQPQIGGGFRRHIEDDGEAPNQAIAEGHPPGHRVEVSRPHKPVQRRKDAIGQVDDFIGQLVADGDFRQPGRQPARPPRRGHRRHQPPAVGIEGVAVRRRRAHRRRHSQGRVCCIIPSAKRRLSPFHLEIVRQTMIDRETGYPPPTPGQPNRHTAQPTSAKPPAGHCRPPSATPGAG